MSFLSSTDKVNLCKQIQQLDRSIRFVGLANRLGSLVATCYRDNLIPLLTEKETSDYVMKAVLRATTREDFESKIGRLEYSIGKYERLIRATIPIKLSNKSEHGYADREKRDDEDADKIYLLLSFDLDSDIINIIETKVLPILTRNKPSSI